MHEVLRVLRERARAGSLPGERRDGFRVALAIEGGGMRGTISAGMALALDELGLVSAFDAVYGASAGAITGAWLLSRPQGLLGWTEPAYALPRPRRPPGRRRPPPRRIPVRFGNTRIRGLGGGVLDPASGWLARGKPPVHGRAPAPGCVRVRPRRHARRFLPFHLIAPRTGEGQ